MIDASTFLAAGSGQRSLHRLRRGPARLGLWLLALGFASAGCSASDHPPPAPAPADGSERLSNPRLIDYDSTTADARDSVAQGGCAAGTTRECRVYLAAHDGIQPCFVGEQRCVENEWSLCDDALLVDANKDDTVIDPGNSGGYGP